MNLITNSINALYLTSNYGFKWFNVSKVNFAGEIGICVHIYFLCLKFKSVNFILYITCVP